MHPDQYALKEPRTEKGKLDNGFTVYYGWHKPSVRTNLIRPSVRAGAPSPTGKAWALPRHSNHPTLNDHLLLYRMFFHYPEGIPSFCIRSGSAIPCKLFRIDFDTREIALSQKKFPYFC
ncbi:MAG: hypothetical protein ACI3V4_10765 [Faecousia sp.]